MDKQNIAIIIGAGPAGLTAAYELAQKTRIKPVIYEAQNLIGGLSATIDYKGNKMDFGPHRFFSKSDRVIQWWQHILPVQWQLMDGSQSTLGENAPCVQDADRLDPEKTDQVMLICHRVTRILFLRKFFNYPIALNLQTLYNLGIVRTLKIILSYGKSRLFPLKDERSLENFFINRFGRELYQTFFQDYTEKVWGQPCHLIPSEWGKQRIKQLSITKALAHAVKTSINTSSSLAQKNVETSLIEHFLYPPYGAGQLWTEVAQQVGFRGGEVHLNKKVVGINAHNSHIVSVEVQDMLTGERFTIQGDYFFSTMPIKDLIAAFKTAMPADVTEVAQNLVYRDMVIVGLLVKKLRIQTPRKDNTQHELIPDNWIYIQERDVKLGRLVIFNNWSPYLVQEKNTVWLGLEYFCQEGDALWTQPDLSMQQFAVQELVKLGFIEDQDVMDAVVVRIPKAYPSYFGSYPQFQGIRDFTDQFHNLFLIGRNGMHRYNNMDHSMLSAMVAVDNLINGVQSKEAIWSVNTEQEYHEEKQGGASC